VLAAACPQVKNKKIRVGGKKEREKGEKGKKDQTRPEKKK
jgi:hypothetical protein